MFESVLQLIVQLNQEEDEQARAGFILTAIEHTELAFLILLSTPCDQAAESHLASGSRAAGIAAGYPA